MPPQAGALDTPALTPLAPSVEKAYYRKCIELKRRLNEVESANNETKLRRLRLDRAIMKMRLERAFLLDELRKRMDQNVDGSDGSGDEGMATPPPDRPHRDKRRRQNPAPAAPATGAPVNTYSTSTYTPTAQRTASEPGALAISESAGHGTGEDGRFQFVDQGQPPALPHGSPYGPPPSRAPNAQDHANGMDIDDRPLPISREAAAVGDALSAGPTMVEENGERKIVPPSETNGQSQDPSRGGFSAVNG